MSQGADLVGPGGNELLGDEAGVARRDNLPQDRREVDLFLLRVNAVVYCV